MSEIRKKIAASIESIKQTISELQEAEDLSELNGLEIKGVATLLHNFYSGIEKLLKLSLQARGVRAPSGPNWHRDLMKAALEQSVLSSETAIMLQPYLGFRQHFSNNYALHLEVDKLEPLVKDVGAAWEALIRDLG